jgi:hypothetical protein
MPWKKTKTAIVVGVAILLAAGTATVIFRKERSEPAAQKLTLKINPEIFIRNVRARAEGTLHTPTDSWKDIWLDILTTARVDCSPPHDTEFNIEKGTIAMRNAPASLEIFRQVVEELNRPDGKRNRLPPNFDSQHTVLVESHFYKMSSSDFDRLNPGPPSAKGGTNESAWWMLEPNALAELKQNLNAGGFASFQSPRIQTSFGEPAQFFVGNSMQDQGVEFDFLPMRLVQMPFDRGVLADMIELKAQVSTSGEFTSKPAGDWPVFAGRTNCAIFARAVIVPGCGLLFRAENPANSGSNNLVVLSEVSVKPVPSPH